MRKTHIHQPTSKLFSARYAPTFTLFDRIAVWPRKAPIISHWVGRTSACKAEPTSLQAKSFRSRYALEAFWLFCLLLEAVG